MKIRVAALVLTVGMACVAGCHILSCLPHPFKPPPPAPPTFSQYHLEGWEWQGVGRVLVLPFLNESQVTLAGENTDFSAEEVAAMFAGEEK